MLFRLFLLGALFIHFMFLAALHFPVISITDLPPPFYCRMNLPSTNLHFTTCYFCFRCVIHIKTSSIPALHTLPPYDSTSPRILRIFGAATTFAWQYVDLVFSLPPRHRVVDPCSHVRVRSSLHHFITSQSEILAPRRQTSYHLPFLASSLLNSPEAKNLI